MSRLLNRIATGELLISDGATGTYLQNNGLEPGGCPEEFNASRPEVIRGMAAAYFEAGSDMVETNSFGGSRYMLAKYGHGDRVEEWNRLAAELAREAAPEGCFVLGSIGPTGEILEEKAGTADAGEMYEVFAEQARGLAAGGVDAVVAAMRDGWRVIQFPQQFPAYPGTEYTTSFLKFEYILEKLEATDG